MKKLTPLKLSRIQWHTLLAAAGALSMIMIDSTGIAVALPSIQRDLMLVEGSQQWIITIYALTLAAAIATGGRLSDVYGRVRIFRTGVAMFAIGSLISGLAVNLPMLLCGRTLQGLGNILMAPSAALLATEAFDPADRGRAMGLYSGLGSLAMVFGPIICGVLVQIGSWRWAFFVSPLIAVAIIMMLRNINHSTAAPSKETFQPAQSILLAAGVGLMVFSLQQSHDWGWASRLLLVLIGIGAILLFAFVYTQLKSADPLVDVRMFTKRTFCVDSLVLFCTQSAIIGQSTYGAIYLQHVLHFNPLETGLTMLIFLVPLMLCAPLSGILYDRFGLKLPVVTGLTLATAGFILESTAISFINFEMMIPALILIGAGIGLCVPQTYTDGTSQVAERRRGSAFGALDTVRQLGGAVGMASIGTVVANTQSDRIISIASSVVQEEKLRTQLEVIMEQAISGKAEALQTLTDSWPMVVPALRDSIAHSISQGYFVGAGMLGIALFCALLLLHRRFITITAKESF